MEYAYYSAASQPYHFMGMQPNPYPHTGVDSETIRSIVRLPRMPAHC